MYVHTRDKTVKTPGYFTVEASMPIPPLPQSLFQFFCGHFLAVIRLMLYWFPHGVLYSTAFIYTQTNAVMEASDRPLFFPIPQITCAATVPTGLSTKSITP